MKKNNAITWLTIIVLISVLAFLAYISDYLFNPTKIEDRNRSAKDKFELMEWLDNSGWKDEIEITSVEYKYNKTYTDWSSTIHKGYGLININMNYSNKEYNFVINNQYKEDYYSRNAHIYLELHYDGIRNYLDSIIENVENKNYIKMIKDNNYISNSYGYNENSFIISKNYRIKIARSDFNKLEEIKPNTTVEEAIKYFQEGKPEIIFSFNLCQKSS